MFKGLGRRLSGRTNDAFISYPKKIGFHQSHENIQEPEHNLGSPQESWLMSVLCLPASYFQQACLLFRGGKNRRM